MSDGYGMLGHVGISFQNSYGGSNVTSMEFFPIISESISEEIEDLVSEGMYGRFEEGPSYEGMHNIAGDIVFEAHPIYVGKALKAWNGQSSSTLVDSAYVHSFIPRAEDFDQYAAAPPMTIEIYKDAGSAFLFYDLVCNEFTVEIANGALWKVTMSVIGGKFSKAVKQTASYLPGDAYPWDATSITLGGVAVDEMSTITIKGSNALEAKHTLNGTKTPGFVKRSGYRTLEISGTVLFLSQTEYDNFTNRTQQRLLINTRGQTVAESYTADLKIDVPQLLYTAFPTNIGGPGMIETSFTGKGKFDTTSNYLMEWTLTNTRDAY